MFAADIYKVLPVEVQSIDDWKSTEDGMCCGV